MKSKIKSGPRIGSCAMLLFCYQAGKVSRQPVIFICLKDMMIRGELDGTF